MTNERGFTLVEVLAALVAGGLLLASISWTVGNLGREVQAPNQAHRIAQIEAITPTLVTLLEGAFPVEPDGSGSTGEASRLIARVSPPLTLGDVGPLELRLEIRRTANGEGLFLAFTSVDPATHLPDQVTRPHLLADGFRDIRFDYERHDEPGRKRLPRLITIRFADDKGSVVPIVVAPRLTSDGRCRFDPISMTCRA